MYVYLVKDNNPWLIWTYRSLSANIKEKAAALNHRCVRSDNLSLIYVLETDIKAMSYSSCNTDLYFVFLDKIIEM